MNVLFLWLHAIFSKSLQSCFLSFLFQFIVSISHQPEDRQLQPPITEEKLLWRTAAVGHSGRLSFLRSSSFFLKVKKISPAVLQTEILLSHSHSSHSCLISGIFHWCQKLHLVGVYSNCITKRELTISLAISAQQYKFVHCAISLLQCKIQDKFWLLQEP